MCIEGVEEAADAAGLAGAEVAAEQPVREPIIWRLRTPYRRDAYRLRRYRLFNAVDSIRG
jgi:hypothetical protein